MSSFLQLIDRLQSSIDALETVIFGDDDATASVDGKTKSSISKSIKEQLANLNALVEGRKAYTTLSSLVNDPDVDITKLAEVWKDTPENNGVYGFDNGNWEKTELSFFEELLKDIRPNIFLDSAFDGIYVKTKHPDALKNVSYNPINNSHELTFKHSSDQLIYVDYNLDIESINESCTLYSQININSPEAAEFLFIYYDESNQEIVRHKKKASAAGFQTVKMQSLKPSNAFSCVFRLVRYTGNSVAQTEDDVIFSNIKILSESLASNLLNKEILSIKENVESLLLGPKTQRYSGADLINFIKDPHDWKGITINGLQSKVPVVTGPSGKHGLLQSSQTVNITVTNSLFSDKISAGVTLTNKFSGQISPRVLLLQYASNGAELSRETKNIPSALEVDVNDSNSYLHIEFSGIDVHEDAFRVVLLLDAGKGQPIMFCNPYITEGETSNLQGIPARDFLDFWIDPELKLKDTTYATGASTAVDYFGDPTLVVDSNDTTDVIRYEIDSLTLPAQFYLSAAMKSTALTAEVGVLFLDKDRAELSRNIFPSTKANKWEKINSLITVPEGTEKVQFRFVNWAAGAQETATFKHITLTEENVGCVYRSYYSSSSQIDLSNTIYLSPNGDDSNAGTKASPMQSGAAALRKLPNGGRIILLDGIHKNLTFSLSAVSGRFEVCAATLDEVRIIYDRDILKENWAATDYENVYSQLCEISPSKYLWHHNRKSGEISIEDRHPLQRGRTHRLSSSKLLEANSLEDCSLKPGSWFYLTDRLYIHPIDSDDPNQYEYYIPTTNSLFAGQHSGVDLVARGIKLFYGRFNVQGCNSYELYECYSLGSSSNGVDRGKTRGLEYRCEYAGAGNDGGNGHNTNTEYTGVGLPFASSVVLFDQWSHDCYDDGDSLHERSEGTYHGGLFEFNGDRGIATSYGSHVTLYGAIAQHNGQSARGSNYAGEGFSIVGDLVSEELGIGIQMVCICCVSIGNNFNYAVNVVSRDENAKLELINCHSELALVAAYSAQTGQVVLRNCTDMGSSVVKRTLDGGQIIVKNGDLVT
ncbi:hypothetical protein [Pseudoalteromonas sp. H103]|uniref:hypothetical protein n=1 Tax=Pseudoalteromonas sp. H103 TaxID=1761893 RepID=UPI0007321AEC|nr:hypothetical protein [Pseudoalteromonas sp. H103]KTF10396.1 hypothetical protein ATS74_10610 [Pseudoalteromonas sp. H103]